MGFLLMHNHLVLSIQDPYVINHRRLRLSLWQPPPPPPVAAREHCQGVPGPPSPYRIVQDNPSVRNDRKLKDLPPARPSPFASGSDRQEAPPSPQQERAGRLKDSLRAPPPPFAARSFRQDAPLAPSPGR
ncbi:hypothetical protein AAHA92_28318 [Salvia divinorum]|uniref:Uncharacterized protein n=1 Tax=Salvia divinorum TaxID=28513 RepID=A0ABD1FUQ2_SALDI